MTKDLFTVHCRSRPAYPRK